MRQCFKIDIARSLKYWEDFHYGSILLEALVYLVVIAVEHDSDHIACRPSFATYLDKL